MPPDKCMNRPRSINQYFLRSVFVVLLFFTVPVFADSTNTYTPERIRIQLKWFHSFQFAGIYAAIEKGFFRDAGIEVELLEGSATINPSEIVASDQAEFGIGNSSLIIDRDNGLPVVAVAAILQHSPFVILARHGAIDVIRDIEGKTLMGEEHAAELLAYLIKAGVNLNRVNIVHHTNDIRSLAENNPDNIVATTAYTSNEPYLAIVNRIPYHIFDPRDIGIDFYGDTLFTSEKIASINYDLVVSVRDAILKGWIYAIDHQNELIDIILDKYMPDADRMQLVYESQVLVPLLVADVVDIGYMSYRRWENIAESFASVGMLDKNYSLDYFLFETEPGIPLWLVNWAYIISGVAFASILLSIWLLRINRMRTLEINKRIVVEKQLKRSFETEKTITRELAVKEKQLKEALEVESKLREQQARFIDVFSHEFRTPLAIVRTNVDLLYAHLKRAQIADNYPHQFDKIERALVRMVNLFKTSLHKEAIGVDDQFESRQIDIVSIVNEAFDEAVKIWSDHSFCLIVDDQLDLTIDGDPFLLGIALNNILDNASNYSPDTTPVVIEIKRIDSEVEINIVNMLHKGAAIDIERLTEKYYRGSNSGDKVGTGVGLYLVNEIIEKHHGTISFEQDGLVFVSTLKIPVNIY